MKIKLPSVPLQSLQQTSIVEVAKTPAAPAPIPVPFPNVPDSQFTGQGVERRFSTRFQSSIEGRLKDAKVPGKLATKLLERFAGMDRSTLDREGRLIERMLETKNPRQALAVYAAMDQLRCLGLPNGGSAQANDQGTLTVRIPGREPVEFDPKPGNRLELPGVTLTSPEAGVVSTATQEFSLSLSERMSAIPLDMVFTLTQLSPILGFPVGAAQAVSLVAWAGAKSAEVILDTTATYLHHLGLHTPGTAIGVGAKGAEATADAIGSTIITGDPDGKSPHLDRSSSALVSLALMPEGAFAGVQKAFARVGNSPAPSSRADPERERMVLLDFVGRNVARFANPETAQSALRDFNLFAQKAAGKEQQVLNALANVSAKFDATAERIIGTIRG